MMMMMKWDPSLTSWCRLRNQPMKNPLLKKITTHHPPPGERRMPKRADPRATVRAALMSGEKLCGNGPRGAIHYFS